MTSIYLESREAHSLTKQNGVATLIITVILLVATILIIIFEANHSLLQAKTAANQNRYHQAFYAAEAGLEYGMLYLIQNNSAIVASASNGWISYFDANITNVPLPNQAKYSVVYTNPVINKYTLMKIE